MSGPGSGTFGAVDHAAVPSVVAFEVADPALAAGSPFHGSAEPSLSFGVQTQGKVRNNRLSRCRPPCRLRFPRRRVAPHPAPPGCWLRCRDRATAPLVVWCCPKEDAAGSQVAAALQHQPAELGTVPVPVGGSWSAAGGPISCAGRPAMPRAALSRRPAWVAALPRPPGVDRRVRILWDWTLTP